MFTMVAENTRKAVSTFAAVTIVTASGFVMDQAHLAAAPRGTVEVGELTPISQIQMAYLPEVVVVGQREGASLQATTTQLPEIVVVAKRVAHRVAQEDPMHLPTPAINAGI